MDVTPPVRLAVGCFENNLAGASVDGRYWPPLSTGDNTVNREFCFIWNKPYSTTPDTSLQIDIYGSSTPMMWIMTCTRRNDPPYVSGDAANGDQFEIVANHLPSSKDLWTFNPSILTNVKQGTTVPSSFALSQNYPNPFNPTTTIRYELPVLCKVTIKIYNLLGQEVRTLENEIQSAGSHLLIWDSKNTAGVGVASGAYFARFTATPTNSDKLFSKTMKMLLMK